VQEGTKRRSFSSSFRPKLITALHVTEIIGLDNNNDLEGPLPEEIGQLKDLEGLSIAACGIKGTIPTQIGLMRDLGKSYRSRCDIDAPDRANKN
jgi:hypothetical protein